MVLKQASRAIMYAVIVVGGALGQPWSAHAAEARNDSAPTSIQQAYGVAFTPKGLPPGFHYTIVGALDDPKYSPYISTTGNDNAKAALACRSYGKLACIRAALGRQDAWKGNG